MIPAIRLSTLTLTMPHNAEGGGLVVVIWGGWGVHRSPITYYGAKFIEEGLLATVRERVSCFSSGVAPLQTRRARSLADHPLLRYHLSYCHCNAWRHSR